MAAATVARLNDGFLKMQQYMEQKVNLTLDLLKFAFGGPENPKACKDIPLG